MKKYKVCGIIIKKKNYKESDKIITVITKHHGKCTFLAKGVRKISSRRGPCFEMFNEVIMILYKSAFLDIVTEITVVHSFSRIKSSLSSIASAYEMCEIADILTRENQQQQEVYDILSAHLHRLNAGEINCVSSFKHDILITLGFLSPQEHLDEFDDYIEQIAERRLRTPKIYE